MQDKNYKLFKYAAASLLISCSLAFAANTKSTSENEKKDKDKSKEAIIFDSCGKNISKKCDKETKVPVFDYSKFIK